MNLFTTPLREQEQYFLLLNIYNSLVQVILKVIVTNISIDDVLETNKYPYDTEDVKTALL